MNKRQKEVLQASLDNEKEVLKALEKNYTKALADIKRNIRELQAMPQTQSKAYQIEFQKQLESQISAYLDVLKGNNYKTITDYMNKCYEEGFTGSIYNLQSFGEGVLLPIDQEAVIKAVKLTGDDLKLSKKLEGNTELLKQNVLAEIQRGFATSLTYTDIARNISNWGNVDMNRSKTIARTEGHRVQCKADMDCAKVAKEQGCDVVKQWDSTLDRKTRASHQRVDKEWRELDEPFSNGLMYPGDPSGSAKEVINCRCSVNDVPRWYAESGGGQYRRDNETGNIIKCRNYAEFKEKYLDVVKGFSAKGNHTFNLNIPKLMKNIDYTNKGAIIKELNAFEQESINLSYEKNCTITSDGKVWYLDGSAGFVEAELIETQKGGSSLKNSYSYHNHPKNETCFSFSGNDVGFFLEKEESYSKASDYKYSYVMRRTEDTLSASYNDIVSEFNNLFQTVVYQKSFDGVIDIDEDGYHEIMKILSKKYRFIYERIKK